MALSLAFWLVPPTCVKLSQALVTSTSQVGQLDFINIQLVSWAKGPNGSIDGINSNDCTESSLVACKSCRHLSQTHMAYAFKLRQFRLDIYLQ